MQGIFSYLTGFCKTFLPPENAGHIVDHIAHAFERPADHLFAVAAVHAICHHHAHGAPGHHADAEPCHKPSGIHRNTTSRKYLLR